MGKATVRLPKEFLLRVSKLREHTDEIVPIVLKAGGEVMLEKVKSNLRSSVGRDTKYPSRSTGQLEGALGLTPVKKDRNGNHDIKIGFAESRRDGVSNAMIANTLEHGKSGQPPKPFLKPAVLTTKKQCIEAMKTRLEEGIDKI